MPIMLLGKDYHIIQRICSRSHPLVNTCPQFARGSLASTRNFLIEKVFFFQETAEVSVGMLWFHEMANS
jgi:hypothetical protein